MTYGYLKDRKDYSNESLILEYADEHGLGAVQLIYGALSPVDDWMSLPLVECLRSCKREDEVIIQDLHDAQLSVSRTYQILSYCVEMGITVHLMVQNVVLFSGMDESSKLFIDTLGLASELDQISLSGNVREPKPVARRGRPLSLESIRLDLHEDEILEYLSHGTTMSWIARYYHVSKSTVKNWVARHSESNADD